MGRGDEPEGRKRGGVGDGVRWNNKKGILRGIFEIKARVTGDGDRIERVD